MFCPSKFIVITVHPSGAPFANPTGEETKGIEGELKQGIEGSNLVFHSLSFTGPEGSIENGVQSFSTLPEVDQ